MNAEELFKVRVALELGAKIAQQHEIALARIEEKIDTFDRYLAEMKGAQSRPENTVDVRQLSYEVSTLKKEAESNKSRMKNAVTSFWVGVLIAIVSSIGSVVGSSLIANNQAQTQQKK